MRRTGFVAARRSILGLALLIVMGPWAAGTSRAAFLVGDVRIDGTLLPTCGGTSVGCSMDVADGVDFVGDMGTVASSTGDFAGFLIVNDIVAMTDFTFNPFALVDPLWAGSGFSFVLLTLVVDAQTPNLLVLRGTGTISGPGFDDTAGRWTFSANRATGATDFTWSSTTSTLLLDFSKRFAPDTIVVGNTDVLTFTIDNSAGAVAATNLDFTDNLPPGIVVATPPNASTTCTGGTLTALPGSGVISYTGGSVAAGAICTVRVDVTGTAVGALANTSGDLTSSAGNSGWAIAVLTVHPAVVPSLSPGGALLMGLAFAGLLAWKRRA